MHVCDHAVHGTDALGTSTILAAAVRRIEPDLVICGMASTDGSMGVLPAMLAERLGWPAATLGAVVEVSGNTVTVRRDDDTASLTVEAELPAVISVTDQSGEARYPSMKGILAAKKKPVETWTLADLGIDASAVGLDAAWSRVLETDPRPPKSAGRQVPDTDGAGSRRWWTSLSPASTSERSRLMAQVLVLVEQRDGKIAKTTYELLTLARRLGDPVAVVLGGAGAALAPALGRYGAARVVVVEDPALTDSW